MKPRAQKPRPKVATLPELRAICRDAPAVWLALCEMANERGSNYVTPTREKLSEGTGITRMKTISKGLTALDEAGWIERKHTPVSKGGRQTATLLSIMLRRVPHGDTVDRSYRGRKTPRICKPHIEGEKRPIAKGRKTPQEFLKEQGAPLSASAERRPHANNGTPYESKAARIEREKMDAIRAAREAGERPEGGDVF